MHLNLENDKCITYQAWFTVQKPGRRLRKWASRLFNPSTFSFRPITHIFRSKVICVPCSSEVSRRNFKHAGVTNRIHFWGMRSGTANCKDIVILSVFPNSDFGKTVVENHIGSKHQVSTKLGLHFTVTWLVYRHKIHVHYRSKFFFVVALCHWHEWSWKKNVFLIS